MGERYKSLDCSQKYICDCEINCGHNQPLGQSIVNIIFLQMYRWATQDEDDQIFKNKMKFARVWKYIISWALVVLGHIWLWYSWWGDVGWAIFHILSIKIVIFHTFCGLPRIPSPKGPLDTTVCWLVISPGFEFSQNWVFRQQRRFWESWPAYRALFPAAAPNRYQQFCHFVD